MKKFFGIAKKNDIEGSILNNPIYTEEELFDTIWEIEISEDEIILELIIGKEYQKDIEEGVLKVK